MRGISRFGALSALWAAAACGNVTNAPDAAPPPDSSPPDSSPDGPPISAAIHRWVIDRQIVPRTNVEAQTLGLDLDGDSVVDNQFGMVLAALASQGFESQAATDAAISRGTILMLAEAAVGVGGPTAATYTMYTGENPQPAPCAGPTDLACRRHLAGTATFSISLSSAIDPPLAGSLANGTLLAGPGRLQVSMTMVFGGTPIVLDLIGARVRLQLVTAGSFGQSVIAGAIPQPQIDTRIYPGIHQGVSLAVAADCPTKTPPDCGCAANSDGKTYLNLFDTMPKDCTITIDEIRDNTLIRSLFAPDVLIGGQPALSAGFGATAIRASFTP